MALYRHYDPQQTKLIAVSYGRQLLPSTFEHALSYLIDSEIDLDRFVARFMSDDAGARAYDPAVLLRVSLFTYSRVTPPITALIQNNASDGLDRENCTSELSPLPWFDSRCVHHG